MQEANEEEERVREAEIFAATLASKQACVPGMASPKFLEAMLVCLLHRGSTIPFHSLLFGFNGKHTQDPALACLDGIPGISEATQVFCAAVQAKTDAIVALGQKEYEARKAEQTEFFEALHDVCLLWGFVDTGIK